MKSNKCTYLVVLLTILTVNSYSQNWGKISEDLFAKHKEIIKNIVPDKTEHVENLKLLRKLTHFYQVNDYQLKQKDTLIIVEGLPEFGNVYGTLWQWGKDYKDVFAKDYYNNTLREFRLRDYATVICFCEYELIEHNFDYRKMCTEWNFTEYDQERQKIIDEGCSTIGNNYNIVTRIIIDGNDYKIECHLTH